MTSSSKKTKSILLVSQYFPPDITAAAFRIGALAEVLHKHPELDLHVLTSYPSKLNLAGSDQSPVPEDCITRVQVKSKSHLLQYLEFMVRSKLKMLKLRKVDWIFVTSPPLSTFLVAYSPFFRGKLMLDIRDLWPDTPVAAEKMKQGALYRFFKWFERWMYGAADEISAVSRPMASYIEQKVPGRRVNVVYNGIPREEFDAARARAVAPERTSRETISLYYAGNIGLLQGLDVVPRALALTKQVPIAFHVVGSGVLRDKLIEEADRYGVRDRLIFHSPMPRSKLVPFLNENADALFINLKRHPILEKTIPSKLFDCLLLQKPIVTGIKGEGREILGKVPSSLFFEQDAPESLAQCLCELSERFGALTLESRTQSLGVVQDFIREKQFEVIAERLAT